VQPGWQLSGSTPEAYERYIVQAFMTGWTHTLLEVAALAPGTRVLDVACGTGVVTRQAAQRVGVDGAVVGVDLNAGMLATARTFPQPPDAAPIEWRESNVTALPFPDAAGDACKWALHAGVGPLPGHGAGRPTVGSAPTDCDGISGFKDALEGEARRNLALAINWAIVKDWSERIRYNSSVPENKAWDFYSAVTARRHGVLCIALRTGDGISGIRFSKNTSNGHFIEDRYIHRNT
jgi:SAM-dependent methyltransferase